LVHLVDKTRLVFAIAGVEAVFVVGVLVGQVEHISNANVLLLPDVTNEGLILYAYCEGVDDIGVRDFLKLIIALHEAIYVIA
jgi:hypothetical protein